MMMAHQKVRKAVFPAAGLGTRFLPATKAQPKEMLPLVDKPIIQYVIEEAVAAGLTSIIIVTGKGKNAIEDHFDVSYELERHLAQRGQTDVLEQVRAISDMINISYVRQGEQLGLGHAVLQARDLVGEEPFAVMLGDDIIDAPVPCMRQMLNVYEGYGGPVVAVQQVPRDEISAYGVIDGLPEGDSGRLFRIRDMVEKPKADAAARSSSRTACASSSSGARSTATSSRACATTPGTSSASSRRPSSSRSSGTTSAAPSAST
jgi:UTP--glucose-1-phosphate uridylyltransferase